MDESEQLRAEIRRVFDAFDTDGNGVINPSEVKGLMVTLLKREPTPEEVQNAVQMMDKNKDGVIELDEFTETMTKWVTDGAEGSNEGPGSPPPFLKKRSKSGRGLDATGHGDGDGGGRKRVHSEIAQFFRQFQARPDVAALQARLLARPPKGEPSPDAWRLGFAPLAPAEKAALLAHAAGLKEYLVKGLLETVCNAYPKDCQYKETKNMKAPNPELNRNYHLYWGGQKKLTFTAGDFLEKGCFKHGPPDPAKHPDHGAILVLRDPRDVIVSRHFYTRHHDPYVPDKYVRQQLAELQTYFGKVEKNYRVAEATDSGAVAFLRYEELNKNSVESMRMLFNFLPLSCFAEFDVSFAEEVYDRFAFEKMTKAEDQGRVAGTTGARKGSEKKVRSGRSFGFAKNLRPQTLKQVEAALNKDKMFGPLFQQYYENEARGREVLEALCSSDPAACLQAAQALSQALSLCVKFDSPAERLDIAYELIELFEMVTEAIPGAALGGPPRSAAGRLCELLDATSPVELQEAACEALYYFVLGPQVPHLPPGNPWHRDQALPKHLVVQHQLLPRLKTVIQAGGHGRPALVGGAARCVGAFAERTPEARGAALASGFLPLLLELVRPDMPTELERPVTYAVAVLLGYTHGGLGGVGGRAAPSEAELRLVLEKLWPLLRRHDAPAGAGAGAEGAAAAAAGAAAVAGAAPPDEAVTANVVLAVRCVLPACHEIPLELTRRLVELTGATWPTLVGGKFAVRALLDCLHDLCVTHPEAAAEAARGGTPLLERLEALLDVDEDALGDLVAAALRLLEALLHEGGLHDAVLLDERRRFVPRLVHLLSSRAVAAELGAARCLFALTLGGAAHLRALAARGAGRALFQVFGRLKQHDDVLADAYGYLGPSFNLELVWLAKRCLANLMAAGEKMRDGDGDGGPHPFAGVFGEEGVDRVAQLHAEVCREVRRGRLSATRDLAELAAGLRDLLEGIAALRRGEEDPRAGEVRAACAEALKDWDSKLAEAVRAQDARETMEVDAAGALPWGEEGGAPSPFAAAGGGATVRLKALPLWGDEFQRDVRILPVPAAARLAELRNYLTACYGTPVELQHEAAQAPPAGGGGGGGGPAGEKITITSQETLSGLLAAAAAAGDLLPIYLLAKTARAGTAAVAAVRLGPREYELRKLRAQGVALSGALLNQIYDYFKQLNVPALDFARFKEGMAPLGLTDAQASEAFAAFDVNKDGGVTLSELACGLSILVDGTLEDRLQYAFMAFDADGNGTLSPDELTQLVAASTGYEAAVARAVAQEVFKQFDANRDGSIDFQEFTQAVLANRVMLSTFWTNGLPGLGGLGAGAAGGGGGGGDHPSASRAPTTQQQRRTRSQQWTSYLARGAQQQQQQQQQQTVGIVKPLSRTRGSNNLAYYQQRQQQQSRSNTNWRAPGGGRDMVNSPVPPPPPRRQGGLEGFSFQKDNRSNAFQRDYDI